MDRVCFLNIKIITTFLHPEFYKTCWDQLSKAPSKCFGTSTGIFSMSCDTYVDFYIWLALWRSCLLLINVAWYRKRTVHVSASPRFNLRTIYCNKIRLVDMWHIVIILEVYNFCLQNVEIIRTQWVFYGSCYDVVSAVYVSLCHVVEIDVPWCLQLSL